MEKSSMMGLKIIYPKYVDETVNKIKIVDHIKYGCNIGELSPPYTIISTYERVSDIAFHKECTFIKDSTEFAKNEHDVDIDTVDHDIHRAKHVDLSSGAIMYGHSNESELFINDSLVVDEESMKIKNYLKELWEDLLYIYPYPSSNASKIWNAIWGIAISKKLSSNQKVAEYIKANGGRELDGIGVKNFEYIKEYFDIYVDYDGNNLLANGDIIFRLKWNSFEKSFCSNIISSKYKMNEVFRKIDGKWSSLSGNFKNMSDRDITWLINIVHDIYNGTVLEVK